jgi:hypothetical protein
VAKWLDIDIIEEKDEVQNINVENESVDYHNENIE